MEGDCLYFSSLSHMTVIEEMCKIIIGGAAHDTFGKRPL